MAIPDPDPAAVKREFEALKKNAAKLAQFSQSAMSHGYFVALEQARIDGSVGPALFGHEYRRYFDIILESIREAQSETEHIRRALTRMQAAATNGSNRAAVTRLGAHPDDSEFQEGLRVFQGWLASLFETYVTLLGMIEGTSGATRKVDEFASASQALIRKRQAAGNMTIKGTDLFKALTEL
jgi:hypothetical protein